MKWALIKNGSVAELTETNPSGRYHKDLLWVECAENTEIGMVYDSELESFSNPETPISQIKNNAIISLVSNYNQACSELLDLYTSQFERLTWNTQVFEANLVTVAGSSGANSTPFFDAFVAANPDFAGPGSTTAQNKAALKATIESNNDEFAGAAGDLTGQLSAKRYAIINAADEAAVDAVDLTFTIPTVNLEDK